MRLKNERNIGSTENDEFAYTLICKMEPVLHLSSIVVLLALCVLFTIDKEAMNNTPNGCCGGQVKLGRLPFRRLPFASASVPVKPFP